MFECYTDGSSKGNPGIAGWGWVAYQKSQKNIGAGEYVNKLDELAHSEWGGERSSTNNAMELTAFLKLILFFEKFQTENVLTTLVIKCDSRYVLSGIIDEITISDDRKTSEIVTVTKNIEGYLGKWINKKEFGSQTDFSLRQNIACGGCHRLYWKNNKERINGRLWLQIYDVLQSLLRSSVKIQMGWVKAHSGIYQNEYADKLANMYAKTNKLL